MHGADEGEIQVVYGQYTRMLTSRGALVNVRGKRREGGWWERQRDRERERERETSVEKSVYTY